MPHLARALVLAVALTGLSASPAHAGTIVFDFEDGLQGWEAVGAVQRVQTQLLGGEWAVFGDGLIDRSLIFSGASISIQADLTDVASISLEEFFAGDTALWEAGFFLVTVDGSGLVSNPVGDANRSLRIFVIEPQLGLHEVRIYWGGIRSHVDPAPPPHLRIGFIDNITFHTIPEPSVLGMLVLGGVAVLARRRAQGGRLT